MREYDVIRELVTAIKANTEYTHYQCDNYAVIPLQYIADELEEVENLLNQE